MKIDWCNPMISSTAIDFTVMKWHLGVSFNNMKHKGTFHQEAMVSAIVLIIKKGILLRPGCGMLIMRISGVGKTDDVETPGRGI